MFERFGGFCFVRHNYCDTGGEVWCEVILCDGGKHATLYRNKQDTVLLDYINPEAYKVLMNAPFAVVMEATPDGKDVAVDYKARIKIVPKNMMTDGLE